MSALEDALALQLRASKIEFEREVAVVPKRKFRHDFRITDTNLLVEVQGGVFVKGAHSTGLGITRDCTKNNLAVLEGYRVLYVTAQHIKSGEALGWIKRALEEP